MHVAVDKTRNGKTPFCVDLFEATVAVERADYDVSANGDVARLNLAVGKIQDAGIADNEISRQPAQGLIDLSFQNLSH
jgi:hypothetical protein